MEFQKKKRGGEKATIREKSNRKKDYKLNLLNGFDFIIYKAPSSPIPNDAFSRPDSVSTEGNRFSTFSATGRRTVYSRYVDTLNSDPVPTLTQPPSQLPNETSE